MLYFTAGAIATTDERAEIAAINAQAAAPYQVNVRRGDGVGSINYGAGIEACDYVAGTPPMAYVSKPVYDPDAPPAPVLPSTQAVVTSGQVVAGKTITVVNNVITAITP